MGSESAGRVDTAATRALMALSIAVLLGASGCAAEPGEFAKSDDVGVVQAAVKDGILLTGDDAGDYTGIVRIWTLNTRFDEFRQFCAGVLITNTLVATAAHCLDTTQEAIDYGWPDVSSDTSRLTVSTNALNFIADGVGAPIYAPDARDLAVFKLARALPVRSRGALLLKDFFRNLGGTPESGASLATCGYGETTRGATSDICNYVSLGTNSRIRGCVDDPLQFNAGVGSYVSNPPREIINFGVGSTPGDSGGATVLVTNEANFADLPLLGINSFGSRCVDTATGTVCGAVSARLDDLKTWLTALANY